MRFSQFFTHTKRDVSEQDSINAHLLNKAGYMAQTAAGVYALLPLGWRSLQKIEQIVREEMNKIGGNELLMSSLQPPSVWQQSGRWADANFRSILYYDAEAEMSLAPTHEEPVTTVVKEAVQSYRDLPVMVYQFQTKFRKELRAKSGLLRGREFRMKDLYSFHPDEKTHNEFYEQVADAYLKVFGRLSLEAYRVKASGGVFTKEFSDEFQVICPSGEDTIFVNHQHKTGYNEEVSEQIPANEKEHLSTEKAIEVGNIFHLDTKYTEPLGLNFLDAQGNRQTAIAGSYGIGTTRLLGTLAELYNDENGLKLPAAIAPFQVYLIDLTNSAEGEKIYQDLLGQNIDVLFDDRPVSAGQKFADADLIGLPIRIVYSAKTAEQQEVEFKDRQSGDIKKVKITELISQLKK